MFNLMQIENNLKNFSDEQLSGQMQSPTGEVPQYMLLSEMQRRKRMRDDVSSQQSKNQGTVAEEIVAAAGMPSGEMGQMSQAMAPRTDVAMNTGQAPMPQEMPPSEPTQMMQEGGPATVRRSIYDYPSSLLERDREEELAQYLAQLQSGMADPQEPDSSSFNRGVAFQPPPAPAPAPDTDGIASLGGPPSPAAPTRMDLIRRAEAGDRAAEIQLLQMEAGDDQQMADQMFPTENTYPVPTELELNQDQFMRDMAPMQRRASNANRELTSLQNQLPFDPDNAGLQEQLRLAQEQVNSSQNEVTNAPQYPVALPEAPLPAGAAPAPASDGLSFGLPAAPLSPDGFEEFPMRDDLSFGMPVDPAAVAAEIEGATTKVDSLASELSSSGGGGGGGSFAGGVSDYSSVEQILMGRKADVEAQRDEAKWMAMANFGLSLMGSNTGNFGTDIGVAGKDAMGQYQESLGQLQDDEDALLDMDLQLAIARQDQASAMRLASAKASRSAATAAKTKNPFDIGLGQERFLKRYLAPFDGKVLVAEKRLDMLGDFPDEAAQTEALAAYEAALNARSVAEQQALDMSAGLSGGQNDDFNISDDE